MAARSLKGGSDYLLIDVSNSFAKFAYATRAKLGRTERVPTTPLDLPGLRSIVNRVPVRRIVVSSVVPSKNPIIRKAAGKVPLLFVSPKCELGVGIDYPHPETIGADRLANAAAVAELYGFPSVVIDFGTAVTFDVVSGDPCYIGGVIAPGLEAMTRYLFERTALLPHISLGEPRTAVGKSTRAAMLSGAVYGYRGLVKEILHRVASETFGRKRPKIVATGGYAELIASKLPEIDAVRPHLTLEGLRIIGNLNG